MNRLTVDNFNYSNYMDIPYLDREEFIKGLTDSDLMSLYYDWDFWARPEQLEPVGLGRDGKFIWIVQAGRGWGKTRTLGQWVVDKVESGEYKYVSLVGAAADEVRSIMIEGESGILACSPPWFFPYYEPSKKKLTWPNGAVATIYYGSEPDKSRGAQSDLVWMDEIAKWKYPEDTFDNILFGLRLGNNPLCGVSSTPKPTKFIKALLNRDDVIITRGASYDNFANLAAPFIKTIIKKYEGTRLGRQEIYAHLLDDNPNALFNRKWIDRDRTTEFPQCFKIAVGVDPQGREDAPEAETGIVVAGVGKAMPWMEPPKGVTWDPKDDHYYIFDDLSINASPTGWAKETIAGLRKYKGDKIIPERNNGGDMVKETIHHVDKKVSVREVWASRGKYTRAEPISTLSEQGYIHHIGTFMDLEDELCEWEPGDPSPNRLDAYVWVLSYLSGNNMTPIKPPSAKKIRKKTRLRSKTRNLPV